MEKVKNIPTKPCQPKADYGLVMIMTIKYLNEKMKDIMMTMMIVYTECDLLVVMAQEDTGHSCLSNSPLPGLRNGLAYVSQAEYI